MPEAPVPAQVLLSVTQTLAKAASGLPVSTDGATSIAALFLKERDSGRPSLRELVSWTSSFSTKVEGYKLAAALSFIAADIAFQCPHSDSVKVLVPVIANILNIHIPPSIHGKKLGDGGKEASKTVDAAESTIIVAVCKQVMQNLVAWFKKAKDKNPLAEDRITSMPYIIQGMLQANNSVCEDVGMITVVWKRGILGLLKIRGSELRSHSERTHSTGSAFDFGKLVASVMDCMFTNMSCSCDQLAKELLRGEGMEKNNLPPGFKLVRFWSSNMISIAKMAPTEFCQCLVAKSEYVKILFRLLDAVHPVFGARGTEASNAESMRMYLRLNVDSCINTCLLHKDVPCELKRKVLRLFSPASTRYVLGTKCQAKTSADDTSTPSKLLNISRGTPSYDIPKLEFLMQLLEKTDLLPVCLRGGRDPKTGKDWNDSMLIDVVLWTADLVRRSYSQIVLLDSQIKNLVERGVGKGYFFVDLAQERGRKTTPSTIDPPSVDSLPQANGITSKVTKSLLLSASQALCLFVAKMPLADANSGTGKNLLHQVCAVSHKLLTCGHPAVVELGSVMLSALTRSLPPGIILMRLKSMVEAAAGVAVSMRQCQLKRLDNSPGSFCSHITPHSSPPYNVLRAIGRAITLLQPPTLDSLLLMCLSPRPPCGKDFQTRERYLVILGHVPLDSIAQSPFVSSLYNVSLPEIVSSLRLQCLKKGGSIFIESVAEVLWSIEACRHLLQARKAFERYATKREVGECASSLWGISRTLLPFLLRELNSQNHQDHARDLIEKTLVSLLRVLMTTAMVQRSPSMPACKSVFGLLRNTCELCGNKRFTGVASSSGVQLSIAGRLGIAHAITRLIENVAVHHMPWYEELLRSKAAQASGSAPSAAKLENMPAMFLGYLYSAVDGLMGEATLDKISYSSEHTPWPLFYAGLKLIRAVLFSVDKAMLDRNKSVIPPEHQQAAIDFIAGKPNIRQTSRGASVPAPASVSTLPSVSASALLQSSSSGTSPTSVVSLPAHAFDMASHSAEDVLREDQESLPRLLCRSIEHRKAQKASRKADRPDAPEPQFAKRRKTMNQSSALTDGIDSILDGMESGVRSLETWAKNGPGEENRIVLDESRSKILSRLEKIKASVTKLVEALN